MLNQQAAVGSGENRYSAVDVSPASGTNYYQLKMIDIDGRFTKSGIVQVNMQNKPTITLYPNPVQDVVRFQHIDAVKRIEILSADGRILMAAKPGASGEINVSKLSSGFYVARLIGNGEATMLSFIKR